MEINIIGGADCSVQLPFIGSTKHTLYKKHGYHTGMDIKSSDVFSFASGVVIAIGKDNGSYAVTVQYDCKISLRYMHLKAICISLGAVLYRGDKIGTADKHVHFEYITTDKEESIWPVRIGTMTYYKHNPELILSGSVRLNANDWSEVTIAPDGYEEVPLTESMKLEFDCDSRGED